MSVEGQKSVKGGCQNMGHVLFRTEPSALIASATYKGSYAQIDKVNEAVANRAGDNGCEFSGAMLSIYHVSPRETQNPSEWVTEVCYPAKMK